MPVPARSDAEVPVTVGVDTHLHLHVAVALDHLGRRLDVLSAPTTEAGYARLLGWAESLGELERVGIEGAGSFGAGLARFLRERGVEVLKVGRPKRRSVATAELGVSCTLTVAPLDRVFAPAA